MRELITYTGKDKILVAQIVPIRKNDDNWKSEILENISQKINQIKTGQPMKSFDEISKTIFNYKSEILGSIATGLIKKDFDFYLNQEYCDCPWCSKSIKSRGKFKKTVEALNCKIDLLRPYFYCHSCQKGFYPLDEALGLASSSKQYDVQDLETWLSTEMTYEKASETYERFTGSPLSVDHMHETVKNVANDLTILDVCPTKPEIEEQVEQLSTGKRWRPIMMIAIDGAHEPVRPEPSPWKGKRGKYEYKEAKGFRIYLLDQAKIVHLISWHQIQDDKSLANNLLELKNAGLIPEKRVRLCFIGDGAPWIWNRTKELFPKSKQILDFYHCSEYLQSVAKAQFGEKSQKAQEWIETTFARLFYNNVSYVLDELTEMKAVSSDAKEKIDKTITYLTNHKSRVQYGNYKQGGYHIGSGAIESANKFICHTRLKKSGAWWYISNSNNILKLRCAQYNGTYDRVIENYKNTNKRKLPEDFLKR